MDFGQLYERYARDVHRFALFLAGDPALAEDLTAETFVRALAGRDALRVDTVKAYLLAIVRNLYRDVRRRKGRFVSLEDAPDEAPSVATQASVDGPLRLEEALEAMQRLPEGEREALVLAVISELPYERIAALLGCSVPAVKVRVHRARVRLRAILHKE
jgi:RNA polymerase sigma-70 factor (ECF subfamily)